MLYGWSVEPQQRQAPGDHTKSGIGIEFCRKVRSAWESALREEVEEEAAAVAAVRTDVLEKPATPKLAMDEWH